MSTLGPGREFDLIRSFLSGARTRNDAVLVGAGDDGAVIDAAPFAISCDLSVENVHFRRDWLSADEIGYRAAVAALSDLAAMAAQPIAALVSFAFSAADATGWAARVMNGVNEALDEYGAMLAGGDVTRSELAAIDVVVIGSVEQPVLRSGARVGDEVWVSGRLGGAAAAVAAWENGDVPAAGARASYARPVARVELARRLSGHATAMIDVSDGIAGDARHIAAASKCRIVIDAQRVPAHPDATLEQALRGGEDYELLFTAPAGAQFEADVTLTRIGDVLAGEGVDIRNGTDAGGYDHFSGE